MRCTQSLLAVKTGTLSACPLIVHQGFSCPNLIFPERCKEKISDLKQQSKVQIEQEVTGWLTQSWHTRDLKHEQPYHSVCLACFLENGSNYQDVLMEMTGQKTVPNVFVNKTHVGGCDKTVQVTAPAEHET